MTLCPIAIVAGCRKCPVFSVCPVKGVIGGYKQEEAAAKPAASTDAKKKPASKGK